MTQHQLTTRRDLLKTAGAASLISLIPHHTAQANEETPRKTFRIGMISASIQGKAQPRNGHNWHFGQYLHPTCDLDALKKHYPEYLMPQLIRQCTKFAHASSEGRPIFVADRESKGAQDINALIYEVLRRLQPKPEAAPMVALAQSV